MQEREISVLRIYGAVFFALLAEPCCGMDKKRLQELALRSADASDSLPESLVSFVLYPFAASE